MPKISRLMIRFSYTFLFLGICLGAVMLIHKAYPLHPVVWQLLPIHIEMVIFGWIIQFTLGTAYWILPRYLEGKPRGDSFLAYRMIVFLNLGILLVIVDGVLMFELPFELTGRILELGAVVSFIVLHWNRIVTYRNKG